ncbi:MULTISPECIES: GntR family transcriptional regulator [Corynebacterium]|uniref:Putative D-xylose utilization operon transcriptional repressor n=1 Tax=Corynebacterium provencense TaxID=1737425 RepID=A0A2Z3YP28_9CORY|nr:MULTISPECIES: GntR family transcriptional regulator [Corynebacterium]AWT25111.1 putative D-xylose utilization operon transcriptional repressor [Corynebacterium provencense]
MQEITEQAPADRKSEPTLREQVRARILSGELEPGVLIPETALAEEFNVSRTPVREALKELQMEGLVDIRPRVGTFVHEPTRREIVELFQLKESLEGLAAALLARRGEVPELGVLQRNIEESDAAAARGDADRYTQLVGEFHWTLVRGADNRKLYEMYERLMNQLAYEQLVARTVSDPQRLKDSDREHNKVLDAIRQKDPYGAEMAMRDHVHASSRAALHQTFDRHDRHQDPPGERSARPARFNYLGNPDAVVPATGPGDAGTTGAHSRTTHSTDDEEQR